MRYKLERALTQFLINSQLESLINVEMRYKPMRALKHVDWQLVAGCIVVTTQAHEGIETGGVQYISAFSVNAQ